MKFSDIGFYRSPHDGTTLMYSDNVKKCGDVHSGEIISLSGDRFTISEGIPDFSWPKNLEISDRQTRQSYEDMAEDYDRFADLPFLTYKSDENELREHMVDLLNLKKGDRVLEVGCGTARAAPHLARRIGSRGKMYLQEISPKLLKKAISKLKQNNIKAECSIANGSYLPFPDNSFDAAHHFGGINTFSEIGRCLKELARVVRPGGKVVVGDEGLGPWLRDSEMGRIMQNSNPLLKCDPPVGMLPGIANNVRIEYVMMGAFYILDFSVGTEAPVPDYHLKIPSVRGGSHWTRYYGNLEGVSDEAKNLAARASAKAGKSMHDWLDNAVIQSAKKQL